MSTTATRYLLDTNILTDLIKNPEAASRSESP